MSIDRGRPEVAFLEGQDLFLTHFGHRWPANILPSTAPDVFQEFRLNGYTLALSSLEAAVLQS